MIHGKDTGQKYMKTLDDVIFEAPYSPTDWAKDALYHLKKYKRVQNKIEKIALGNIEDTLDKLDNKPLTWDELKTMEGKPVWVEDHNDDDEPYNRWYIVERFIKEQGDEYAVLNDYYFSRKYFNDKTDGWQAYKKERE